MLSMSSNKDWETYSVAGASSPRVPLHAVEAHEHAIADEQCNPHKHVACPSWFLWQKDECNYITQHISFTINCNSNENWYYFQKGNLNETENFRNNKIIIKVIHVRNANN